MRLLAPFLVMLVVGLWAAPAEALDRVDGYGYAGLEVYTPFAPSGHGLFILGARLDGLPRSAELELQLNTDTIRAGFRGLELADGWTTGAVVLGQYQFAGLLTDHYRNGVLVEEAGISASRIGGSVYAELEAERDLFVRFEATADRWYFSRLETTGASFVLPAETWLVSPRLRLTYWGYDSDPSHHEMHRPFWRTNGFGAGVVFGIDHRTTTRPWGVSPGARNDPETYSGHVSQWARWGSSLGRFRLELFEEAGLETGGDDLTRRRLGGLNPYVAIIPGAPWASILTSAWVNGGARGRVQLSDTMELGPVAGAALVRDPDRTGANSFGWATGFGVELDWRPGDIWQVDASVGYSPDTGIWDDGPQLSLFLGGGRSF